jgi:TIR domain
MMIEAQPFPTVFISYSHSDKDVARRLVRELTPRGVKVWLDERELRVGTALTSSIRRHIQSAETLLVVASAASANSEWVGQEIEFAKENGKTIIPLFVEAVSKHPRFKEHLGLDGTGLQEFAHLIRGLIRDLYESADREMPAFDPVRLEVELRGLAKEEPNLAPLILGGLDSEGQHYANIDFANKVAFHKLDYAVNTLFELKPHKNVARQAAEAFRRAGAGVGALLSWIEATGDGGLPLVTAVGDTMDHVLIPTATKLLAACRPPNDHALYQFIGYNSVELDAAQRRSVIGMITWPVRPPSAERLSDVLGKVALDHFPDAPEIQRMWSNWIYEGGFDGESSSPIYLARFMASAHKEGLSGWGGVQLDLRNHVRSLLRSADKNKVDIAMEHIKAAADAGAPVLGALLAEADGVSGTSEWNDWKKCDFDTAYWWGMYVHLVAEEARGGQDWLKARKRADKLFAFEKIRREGT